MKQVFLVILLAFGFVAGAQNVTVRKPKKQKPATTQVAPKKQQKGAPKKSTSKPTTSTKRAESKNNSSATQPQAEVKQRKTYTLPSNISYNSEAASLYQKAMNDDVAAMCELGKLYLNGKGGVSKDYSEAFRWLKKASDAGNANAMAWLSDCYEFGWGTEADIRQAWNWANKSADLGDAYGINNVGTFYSDGKGGIVQKDVNRAFELYKKSAELGDPVGKSDLAGCYFYGDGVAMNQAKAFELYSELSASGDINAKAWVGICYTRGWGVVQDRMNGKRILEETVSAGSEVGTINLAAFIVHGWFCEGSYYKPDYKKAYNLFCKYPDNGLSQFYLAWYNMFGIEGVTKNREQAFAYYKHLAEYGKGYENIEAMNNLAVCYELGIGCSRSMSDAYRWYLKAANAGNRNASYAVARFRIGDYPINASDAFAGNIVCKTDENYAISLFKKLLEGNDDVAKLAAFSLGMHYQTARNKKLAKTYFKQVVKKGDFKDACKEIQRLVRRIWGKDASSVFDLVDFTPTYAKFYLLAGGPMVPNSCY